MLYPIQMLSYFTGIYLQFKDTGLLSSFWQAYLLYNLNIGKSRELRELNSLQSTNYTFCVYSFDISGKKKYYLISIKSWITTLYSTFLL